MIRLSLVPAAFFLPTPSAAQDIVQLPLFDGALVLSGEVGLLASELEPDVAVASVWRPVQFGTPEKPLAGRMDCKLGGLRTDYTEAMFDLRQRYRDSKSRRREAGLDDDRKTEFEATDEVARLQVTGNANGPHRHYVLTYLALRDGDTLYDLRLNCEFRHLQDPGSSTDYAAIMHRYIDIAVPVAAAPTAFTATTEQSDS